MKNLLIISFILICNSLFSQNENPFRSIGKKGEIITLSNGKFQESHPYDSLQKIGSVVMNINTGTIYQILDSVTLYSEATLEPTTMSRFYSIDPLAAKFAHNSPYAFSENRVIDAIELEGLESFLIQDRKIDNSDLTIKVLTVTDINAPFQVVDEEGNIRTDFKYCELEKQMKEWTKEGISTFSQNPMLNTPNKDGSQKSFGEVNSKGQLTNFNITITDFTKIKYVDLEGGLSGTNPLSKENVLQVGTVPEQYDLIKVYLPTQELKDEYKKQWQEKGYDKDYNYDAKNIVFLEQPEEGNLKSKNDTIQITFCKKSECTEEE